MSNKYNPTKNVLRDQEEDLNSIKKTDRYIFFILLTSIILIPLLIGAQLSDVISPIISQTDALSSGTKGDIFSSYKFIGLIILTIVASVLFLYKLFFLNYSLPKQPVFWFILLFVIAIILSTMFAPYKSIALTGQYNRADGGLSYMCYITLMFIAMNIQYPKNVIKYLLYAFYPFIIINFVLTTMNFTGHDALGYSPIKSIISILLPEGASIDDGAQLLGTLNQWNYMSGMSAVITLMLVAAAVVEVNNVRKSGHLIMGLLALATMFMSISTSGFLTIVVITLLLIVIACKATNKKNALITLGVFFILSAPIFHMLASENSRVWTESIGFFTSANPYIEEQPVASIQPNSDMNLDLFTNRVYADELKFSLPTLPESGMSAGSGRLYIWGKAIETLKARPLIGYGLDTFMYNFPHNNIDARAGLRTETKIVDKPHSMYIGILFGTGIIGFIGFMGIALMTTFKALKSIFNFQKKSNQVVILGIAWLAFLVQGLFNDTLPGTAAALFTIAGMMMALLHEKNVETEESIS